jgi:hypothetical protein
MKLPVFMLLAVLAGSEVQAQDQVTLERRLQSVGTLIESSSAARQIESSGENAARDRREKARALHQQAGALVRSGDLAGAAKLLDLAAREMMSGARLARPEQVTGEKTRHDFDVRLESTKALLAAQRRITQEKSAPPEALEAARGIEADIAAAEQMAREGKVDAGRARLDRAYLTARVSIESMRRGDTLVRSLNFASKQEEFDYEIDRNDTHQMLIKVLLADRKDASGELPPMMRPFVDKAGALRTEAEGLARRGDHEAAIKALEESTRQLVRAIRAGGIYIPG